MKVYQHAMNANPKLKKGRIERQRKREKKYQMNRQHQHSTQTQNHSNNNMEQKKTLWSSPRVRNTIAHTTNSNRLQWASAHCAHRRFFFVFCARPGTIVACRSAHSWTHCRVPSFTEKSYLVYGSSFSRNQASDAIPFALCIPWCFLVVHWCIVVQIYVHKRIVFALPRNMVINAY